MQHENNVPIPEDAPNLALNGSSKVGLDIRTELGCKLREVLIEKRLKQRELAALLAVQQPEISHLFNGHFTRFTIDKLIRFFNQLGWVVEFQVYPHKAD